MRFLNCLRSIKVFRPKRPFLNHCHYSMSKQVMDNYVFNGFPLSEVINYLTSFAPLSLAESWDNVGLLIEPATPTPITKALLTIDLTEDVVKEAVEDNVNLIIAYHPPIFQPLKRITNSKWKERIVATCLEQRIAVFSPHTSWDAHSPKGLSDWLASAFSDDLENLGPIIPSATNPTKEQFSHQVLILCPSQNLEKCMDVLSHLDTKIVSETKMDMGVCLSALVKEEKIAVVEKGLREIHSYFTFHQRNDIASKDCGTGRIGQFKSSITLSDAVKKIKLLVNMSQIRLAIQRGKTLDSPIQSVAVVAGSGASVLRGVCADLYVTGEMLHHDILEANHSGASVILINHSDSERGYLEYFAKLMIQHFGEKLKIIVSKSDKDPILIV